MSTLRTALREQSPSLALQRAAADEIARLDALVRELQGAQAPVAEVVSSGPANFPLLRWLSADASFSVPVGTRLAPIRDAAP